MSLKRERKKILIVDDEDHIREVVSEFLEERGFSTLQAENGRRGLQLIVETRPDLVVLDVELPDMSGYEVCKRIREIPSTRYTPVIMLTAHKLEKEEIAGFHAGADDYVTKPFSPTRLLLRMESAMGRNTRDLNANPLTHLPGNQAIIKELQERINRSKPYAVLYFDLNSFKAFNDRYGFLRGDQAIKATAQVLSRQVSHWRNMNSFLGHIGGDDFVAIVDTHDVAELCESIIKDFDETILSLYDEEDRQRGMIVSIDRTGNQVELPMMGIAIAVVTNEHKKFSHPGEISLVTGDLKKLVKMSNKSSFVIDRRI